MSKVNKIVDEIGQMSISDISKNGISKALVAAENSGLVIVTKNHVPTGMLVSLTSGGFMKFIEMFAAMASEDSQKEVRDFSKFIVRQMRESEELF